MSSKPEKVHQDYPDVTVVPTLDRLLADKNIALVVISTPNDTHYEFAKRAIEAGKHVIVEKPFTIHAADADELIELARQRNVMLSVYQNRRWDNDFFQIHGSKGSFIKYGLDSQEDALKAGKRPGDPGWGEDNEKDYGELTIDVGELTVKGKVKTLTGGYERYYQGIVAALTQGKPAPVSAEEGRNTIQVIEYALQSQKEQRAIAFKSDRKE